MLFTTFGPDTLHELRQAWQQADRQINCRKGKAATVHVNDFMDMHDIGDAMVRAGFAEPVMDAENLTVTYPDVMQLMNELKAIGANNAALKRQPSLTGAQRLRAHASGL